MILHNFVTLRGGGFLANSAGGCGKSVRNAEVFPVTRCLGLAGVVFSVRRYFGIVYYWAIPARNDWYIRRRWSLARSLCWCNAATMAAIGFTSATG